LPSSLVALSLLWQLIDLLTVECVWLMLVSREWHRFFVAQDWDTHLRRWHRAQFREGELGLVNAHERDHHVSFIGTDGLHQYTVTHWLAEESRFTRWVTQSKRHPLFVSVTTFISSLFPKFDDDAVIAAMMQRESWPYSRYYGMQPEEIKALWRTNNDEASRKGTVMHANIENYYNGRPYDPTTEEFALFQRFVFEELSEDLVPFRIEWMLWDTERLQWAGSIDMTYCYTEASGRRYDERGRLRVWVVDWKRTREIKTENKYEKGCTSLTAAEDACNRNKYDYQPRQYKMMLEAHYGVVVVGMALVILHPNLSAQGPRVIRVECDRNKEARILRYRRQQLRDAGFG